MAGDGRIYPYPFFAGNKFCNYNKQNKGTPSLTEKVAHKALLATHTSLGGQAPANPYEDAWSTVVAKAGAAPGTIEIDLSGSAFNGKIPYGVCSNVHVVTLLRLLPRRYLVKA